MPLSFLFFFSFWEKMRYTVRRNLSQNRNAQHRTQPTEHLKMSGALSENITSLALWSRNGHSVESNSMSQPTVLERSKHSLEELHSLSRLLQICLFFSPAFAKQKINRNTCITCKSKYGTMLLKKDWLALAWFPSVSFLDPFCGCAGTVFWDVWLSNSPEQSRCINYWALC